MQQPAGQPWTEEAVLTFWESISEQEREVMREIAKKPDGYSADLLERTLSITTAELGSCMRSIGRQVEHTNSLERYERPVVRDWESHIYMMPQDLVELIRRLKL